MKTASPSPETPIDEPAPAPTRHVEVPGGRAAVAGEVRLVPAARPDEQLVLQALHVAGGEHLLRLGYRRSGRAIRGPVSATPAEVAALVALAAAEPAIADLLQGVTP